MPQNDSQVLGPLTISYVSDALVVAWEADLVPDGYVVDVQLLDAHGNPLEPVPTSVMVPGSVSFTGKAIVPGVTIQAALRVVSPFVVVDPIELVALDVPDGVVLRWAFGAIQAHWLPVIGATDYGVVVSDDVGRPLDPQPETNAFLDAPAGVVIDASTLEDFVRYQVSVRAKAGRLLGPAAPAVAITIDRSQPASPLLQALLTRLKAAQENLSLAPEIIDAADITTLLGLLLGCPENTLPVADAVITHSPDDVTVTGTVFLFGKSGTLRASFTQEHGLLQLTLRFPLGAMTVSELKRLGLVPTDVFGADSVAGLAGFPALEVELDSAARQLRVTGPEVESAWSVFGIPGVSLTPVTPEFSIQAYRPIDFPRYVPRVKTTLIVGSVSLPMYLELPTGLHPWEAGLDTGDGLVLGNLTDIALLFGASALNLPEGLVALGQITLDTLTVSGNPNVQDVWSCALAFTFGSGRDDDPQAPTWEVIPNVLELSGLSVALSVRLVPDGAGGRKALPFGNIVGRFQLGGIPMNLHIPVPGDGDWWVLRGRSKHANQALQFSDLSSLLHNSTAVLGSALEPLGNVEGFTLHHLLVKFRPNPSAPSIKTLELAVSVGSWTIPKLSEWFRVDRLALTLAIENPLDGNTPHVAGELSGQLTLGRSPGVSFGIVTRFDNRSSRWSLRLGAWPATLPGVDSLAVLLPSDDIQRNLPSGLPLSGAVDLNAFGFVYDGAQGYFPSIDVTLRNSLYWSVVPDLLTLDTIDVSLKATQASASAARVITGHIKGTLRVLGAEIELSASAPAAEDPWCFQGRLASDYRIDFQSVLRTLVSPDIILPSGYGFPTALTFLTAEATLVPDTGALDLVGFAYADWSLDFANTTFAVNSLGGYLHRAGSDSLDSSQGKVIGWFTWEALTARASLAMGGPGVDTVVEVEVSNAALDAQAAVGKLVGTKGPLWDSLPLPTSLPALGLAQAGVVINLTQHAALFYGASTQFGQMGLLIQQSEESGNWNYLAAAALADDFRFASIHTALAPVDRVLRVKDAGFGISSFSAESLQAMSATMPRLSAILKLASGPNGTVPLGEGANLWGTLDFNVAQASHLANLKKVLAGVDTGPTISVYARIAPTPGESLFRAQLGNFALFDAIRFENIVLEYRPIDDAAPERGTDKLSLWGRIYVKVGASTLGFDGTVSITQAQGWCALETTQPLVEPLGIPLTLKEMKLGLTYHFQSTQPTTIKLSGQAGFGAQTPDAKYPVNLEAKLLFSEGRPEVVAIALTAPLSVDDLLTTILPNKLWPTGWLQITFKSGRLYYTNSTKSFDNIIYKQGFNLETSIDIYGFEFAVEVSVVTEGAERGLTVTGRTIAPVPLVIASLTSEHYDPAKPEVVAGPGVTITTVGQNTRFGLSFGLLFFKRYMGKAELMYSATRSEFEGAVQAPFMGTDAELSFAWSKVKGFRILDWPLAFISEVFDYAKRLSELSSAFSSGNGCAAISQRLFDKVISTHYQVKVSPDYTPPSPPKDGSYVLPLSITCTAQLMGRTLASATVDVPLIFEAPESLDYDGFCHALLKSIGQSADAIVQELLTHPDKLATFIGVVGLQKLAPQVLASLLCRGVKSELVKAQSVTEASAGAESATSAADAAVGASAAAAAAADAAAAATSAELAIGLVGTIGGILGSLVGIVSGLKSLFGVDKSPEQQRAEAAQKRAQQACDDAIKAVEKRLAVRDLTLTYAGDITLHAQWSAVAGTGVQYEVQAFNGADSILSAIISVVATNISHPSVAPGGEYRVRVRAFIDGESRRYHGEWQEITHNIPATAESLARMLAAQGKTASEAAPLIRKAYPAIPTLQLARLLHDIFQSSVLELTEALHLAGVAMGETAQALKQLYPNMTAVDVAAVLMAVYQGEPTDVHQLALILRIRGKTPSETAAEMKTRFPDTSDLKLAKVLVDVFQAPPLSASDLARALRAAGLPINETSSVLRTIFSFLTATDMARALMDAYHFPNAN